MAADGWEELRAVLMQTEEQLKSSPIMEGGFSLQRIKDNTENRGSASGRQLL